MGIDGYDIFEKFALGESRNVEFVARFRENLGATLDRVMEISPFDVCIVGGGVADWMGAQFDSVVNNLGYNVIRASLGNSAGMYGAYAHYKENRQ